MSVYISVYIVARLQLCDSVCVGACRFASREAAPCVPRARRIAALADGHQAPQVRVRCRLGLGRYLVSRGEETTFEGVRVGGARSLEPDRVEGMS